MVLSSYERKDSPFVWIQYGLSAGERQTFKTAIRKTDREKKRKIAAELRRFEVQLAPLASQVTPNHSQNSAGWNWVEEYIRSRYAGRAETRRVYLVQWGHLRTFLVEEREIVSPTFLTREDVFEYPVWRRSEVKEKSGRSPKLNTALGELKLLGLILDEAVARGLVAENSARRLQIEREETPLRPEFSDAQIALIRAALGASHRDAATWMKRSFELALHTGLRFSETRLHRDQVRIASDDILIEKPKGGRRREFAIPIYASVRDAIDEFLESRREYLWSASRGRNEKPTGVIWREFFDSIGLQSPYCFHCTRVTFITRGLRAGVPEAVMMKMVNHGATLISRIYQRWTPDDVRRYADRVAIPSLSAAPTRSRHKKVSARSKATRYPRSARPSKPRRCKPRAQPG